MTLLLDNRQDFITDDLEDFFNKVLKQAVEELDLCLRVEVSLLLVNNEEIRQLNRDYRGKDKATDVLSFPMLELDPLDESSYHETLEQYVDAGTGELVLGDIVISVEMAIEQAKEYGHSIERELAFLMIHGLLHLLGYDHEKDEQNEQVMFKRQEDILKSLKLGR